MSAITEETLSVSGILLTKTFGQQQAAIDRFRNANAQACGILQHPPEHGRALVLHDRGHGLQHHAGARLLAGRLLAITGHPDAPTIGDIVAFTTLQSRLFFPLGQLLNVQVEVQGALALFDRIFEYLDMEPEIVDAPDADRTPTRRRSAARSATAHVSFRYPSAASRGRGAGRAKSSRPDVPPEAAEAPPEPSEPPEPFGLEDIDFEVEPGQLVALVGPSGSGKTTTTYLVPRLYDVDDGAVEIDGVDVRQITLASLGDIIGVVTQETYLFHATRAREPALRQGRTPPTRSSRRPRARPPSTTASWSCPRATTRSSASAATSCRAARSSASRSRGCCSRTRASSSSTRRRQRLDTVSERLIQAAIERAMAGRTTLAIAHRLSTILRADLILVYERGRIVERGTHASCSPTAASTRGCTTSSSSAPPPRRPTVAKRRRRLGRSRSRA